MLSASRGSLQADKPSDLGGVKRTRGVGSRGLTAPALLLCPHVLGASEKTNLVGNSVHKGAGAAAILGRSGLLLAKS